ncbi:hypothetical protein [Azospirillum endophyticum]
MNGETYSGSAGPETRRSDARWIWLLADLSLDRANAVIPCLGFPVGNCRAFQSLLRHYDRRLVPGGSFYQDIYPQLSQDLRGDFGPSAREIWRWLTAFPCDEEASRPAPAYWDKTFLDLLVVDPTPPPEPVNPQIWRCLGAALRMRMEPQTGASKAPLSVDDALYLKISSDVSKINAGYTLASDSIDDARKQPLSKYDAGRYLTFGWNDHGVRKGLACLEHGIRMFWIISIWQEFSNFLSQDERRAIERLAHRRDRELWLAVREDPSILGPDVARYGVDRETMLNDLFPEPPPPPLDQLLN